MGNKIDTERFILEYSQANKADFKDFNPDFEAIEQAAIRKTRKLPILSSAAVRIAAAVVVLFVVFNMGILFNDSAPVRAYRNRALTLVSSLLNNGIIHYPNPSAMETVTKQMESIQVNAPYQVPTPKWLPDGYSCYNVGATDDHEGFYLVTMKFANGADKTVITITNDDSFAQTKPNNDEPTFERCNVKGLDVYILEAPSNESNSNAIYVDKQGLFINISGPLDKQSLIKIISNMS